MYMQKEIASDGGMREIYRRGKSKDIGDLHDYKGDTMDQIDRKILSLLKQNARMPLKAIAEEVYLSSPAVSSRIEHMESSGLIEGYHVHLSPEKLNLQIKAFINLEVDPAQKAEFYPYIESVPNVIECDCVTGDYSMLLMVYFQTTQELDLFINQLQHFGKTRTQIVFSTPVENRGISVEAIPVETVED